MSIKINISELLGRYKMTQKDLALKTGIRPGTISTLYHETTKRLEIEHLDKICSVFNCQPGDILQFIPDDNQKS